MRKLLALLVSSLLFFSHLCLAAKPALTVETVNEIVERQFGENFELLPVKPAFVEARLQPDGRQDIVAIVRLKRAALNARIPENITLQNPYPAPQPAKESLWNDFANQQVNALVIIHADKEGRFDTIDATKHFLIGETALLLTQLVRIDQEPAGTGDNAMRVTLKAMKDKALKRQKVVAIEFYCLGGIGWIYWRGGKYRWEEGPFDPDYQG